MSGFGDYLKVVGKSFKIVGGYIAYGTDIVNRENGFISTNEIDGKGVLELLPAINEIGVADINEFILTGPSGLSGQVTANNHLHSTPSLRSNTLDDRYLDTTKGHLKIGNDVFILNLSGFDLGVTTKDNIPVKYITQVCNRLDYYKGKIIIYKMDYVPLPQNADEGLRGIFYNEYSRQQVRRTGDTAIKDSSLEILDAASLIYNKAISGRDDISCGNMIRVVSMLILDNEEVNRLRDDYTLYIKGIDVCMNLWGSDNVVDHPLSTNDIFSMSDKLAMMEKNASVIYLVDHRSNLKPLFTYLNGTVIEIPVVKNTLASEGLYININQELVRGVSGDMNGLSCPYTPIDEIDKLPFIYKTVEEATIGANRSTIFESEMKDKENELRVKLNQLKSQNLTDESKINELKREIEVLKADAQKRSIEREEVKEVKEIVKDDKEYERSELTKYMEQKRNEDKYMLDMVKQLMNESADREKRAVVMAQENTKWDRETTKTNGELVMTTLKVVGSVVALGLAGYAVFKKL